MKITISKDSRNRQRPWVCRWFGEYNPATGKQRRYSKSFARKAEAEQWAAKKSVGVMQGEPLEETKETLEPFVDKWLRLNKSLRPETLKLYGYTTDRLLDYFGPEFLLRKLTTDKAEVFVAELKPLKGEKLSDWTKHRTLRNCKTIFESAVRWHCVAFNPFHHIKGPRLRLRPWHYVTPDEYKALLEATPTLHRKVFYALCYTGGLRFSEAVSLRWVDINFLSSEVKLDNRAATDKEPEFLLKDYERRSITLPSHTVEILENFEALSPYVVMTKEKYERMLKKWRNYQESGRSWRWVDMFYNAGREFGRHVKNASIEVEPGKTLSIHTLRKSCIQNWANELPMNVTKELAGHSSISTTATYYTQVSAYHRAKAATTIDNLLAKKLT